MKAFYINTSFTFQTPPALRLILLVLKFYFSPFREKKTPLLIIHALQMHYSFSISWRLGLITSLTRPWNGLRAVICQRISFWGKGNESVCWMSLTDFHKSQQCLRCTTPRVISKQTQWWLIARRLYYTSCSLMRTHFQLSKISHCHFYPIVSCGQLPRAAAFKPFSSDWPAAFCLQGGPYKDQT